MDEQVVLEADRIYRWEGPKMKATLLSAKIGRLVLTDQRLMFVSKTEAANLSVPLAAITRCEGGKKRALIVSYRDEGGAEQSFAFGEKMGMPGRDTWTTEVNARRA